MEHILLPSRDGHIRKTFEHLKKYYPDAVYNKFKFNGKNGEDFIHFGYYDLLPGFQISIFKTSNNKKVYYEELKSEQNWIIIKFVRNKTIIDPIKKTLTINEFGSDEVILYNKDHSLDTVISPNQYIEMISIKINFEVLYDYSTLTNKQLDEISSTNKKIILHERMVPKIKAGIDELFKCQEIDEGVIGYSISKSLEMVTHFLIQIKNRFTTSENYGISDYNYNQMIAIRDFLLEDLSINIEISDITKKFGVSTANLHRNFKKVFGTSPHKFIKKSRLDNAFNMLKNTDLPIVEIADQLGFTHASHLTNTFKKEFAITPKQLRKKINHL
ncbi:helix-turn-helix transcriptional regulator [Flammeovirga kamogawensis]|uniref:AraC family transcriptional regulator n=1 Tax=Flammeovirga kamogawensis TaxID=373891 RepID=A0ABX8H4R5_9BACT|nr:helix-turn-helix domain-containing protein [Flammeovirga kamogawensis]MBB6461768.1 AraC-like DNA-binding protein [Flammeovirga kamogawensis]QWG10684.1 AraC family transcriptional regulator [Flammeovirga kamogawensis]TRX63787.1 helix-turn-helix domain-containing protein [Flammeovirga kamogawensis]